MKIFLNKSEFIKRISKKAKISQKDTKEFLDAEIAVLQDCILDGIGIQVEGLGRLYYIDLPERKGFKPIPGKPGEGENVVYPPARKVMFRLSETLRNIVKK